MPPQRRTRDGVLCLATFRTFPATKMSLTRKQPPSNDYPTCRFPIRSVNSFHQRHLFHHIGLHGRSAGRTIPDSDGWRLRLDSQIRKNFPALDIKRDSISPTKTAAMYHTAALAHLYAYVRRIFLPGMVIAQVGFKRSLQLESLCDSPDRFNRKECG